MSTIDTLKSLVSRKVLLYVPPVFLIDPQANFWQGTYEKRVNELNPIGRIGSIRQKFGTKSTKFVIKGELNFENLFRKWNRYFKGLAGVGGEKAWFFFSYDARAVKYFIEYLYTYDSPIFMKADLDMAFVTIDKMSWEQSGDERMVYKYTLELYEVLRIPPVIKYPLEVAF